MVALPVSAARDDVKRAVDALVGESIDYVSTHALGEDLVDIRQAIDRLEAEFIRRLHRFDAAAARSPRTAAARRPGCAITAP